MSARIFVWPKGRPLAMRPRTDKLAIHCTATREGQDIDATTVDGWHLAQGWAGIGYHYLIGLDGSVEAGRPEGAIGSGIAGHNSDAIHIVYVGGLDRQGKAKDTRTEGQKTAMAMLVRHLDAKYRFKRIGGHRDYSPDKNGNGIIERFEWLKECPCFDVAEWLRAEKIRP
jgi:N-acetylmuramoyl-L-alanine amidase